MFCLFIHFSFSPREHSVIDFSAYILARLFIFYSPIDLMYLFIFIPPVYKVYRGYIVFAFSVTMFVCLFVNFFFPSKISQELLDIGL